ncbi:hypothetical protein E2562_034548 [Oryza meyeriana var. granulata]|uniref:Uncharacterized protein n=1 Tax=Oryza meyeriana var. granulata TaxID=110450 RepID=A0A6G1ED69_9ORYZ|nr:hypothetical protein E2562_034548 [Oryza meyeriana var. granulata]
MLDPVFWWLEKGWEGGRVDGDRKEAAREPPSCQSGKPVTSRDTRPPLSSQQSHGQIMGRRESVLKPARST